MQNNYDKAFHYAYLIGEMTSTIKRSIKIIEESNHPAKEYYLKCLNNDIIEYEEKFHLINSRKYKNNEQI